MNLRKTVGSYTTGFFMWGYEENIVYAEKDQ
jgi:hypothetical protein